MRYMMRDDAGRYGGEREGGRYGNGDRMEYRRLPPRNSVGRFTSRRREYRDDGEHRFPDDEYLYYRRDDDRYDDDGRRDGWRRERRTGRYEYADDDGYE